MKTYIGISLFINFLLCSVFYKSYYFEKHFHNHEHIEATMALSNQLLSNQNEVIIDDANEMLVYKPQLNKLVNIFFQKNTELTDCLIPQIESLLQQPFISDEPIECIVQELDFLKAKQQSLFIEIYNHRDVMQENKIRQKEIDKEIERINNRWYNVPAFSDFELNTLSQKEKRLMLQTIILDLRSFQTYYNQKVAELTDGGRGICCGFGYGYPFMQVGTSVAQMGVPHKIKFYGVAPSGCTHYPAKVKNRTSIFWDGKRVEEKSFKQETKTTGYQKHEAVVLWVDENDQIQSDTSYFQFYVKP